MLVQIMELIVSISQNIFKKVIAFEADPRIYKLLDFNTENFLTYIV